MGRAQIERIRIEELRRRISEGERRRKELINYLQGLKDKWLDRELTYSEYNEIIGKKSNGKTIPDWINYYENYINDCKEMIDKEKRGLITRRIFSVFLFSFIGLLLILALFNVQTLIGFAVREEKQEFVQNIGMEFTGSTDYEWKLENAGDLLSAKLSGSLEGGGAVKIYLDNLLIFDSERLKAPEQGAKITGQAAGELGNESYSEENKTQEEASQKKLSPSQEELPSSETEKQANETKEKNESEIFREKLIGEQPKKAQAVRREFADICEETCDLEKLNLNKSSYTLRIEITNAKLKIDRIKYEIIPFGVGIIGEGNVTAPENITLPEENITIPEINASMNITGIENITKTQINISNVSFETKQYRAVINKPVKWIKIVKISELDREGNISIEIPKESQNISVKTGGEISDALAELEEYGQVIIENKKDLISGAITGNIALDIKNNQGALTRLWEWLKGFTITGNVIQEEELSGKIIEKEDSKEIDLKDIAIETQANEIAVEYYTEGPSAVEEETKSGKRVIVSGKDELNYTDILAFEKIPEIIDLGQEEKIKIYWKEEGRYVNFSAYDLDGNGKIDYVEWNVPHLSNQTFEIILIAKAEHLDKDRNYISDIYEQVKELDGNWSETIGEQEYVRVKFERNLTSEKDITLYPRIVSGEPRIEIYEINKNEVIAQFESLKENEYNKVYLSNLIGEQDSFDLRVVGGSVEIEHIIDPPAEVLLVINKYMLFCGEMNNYTTIFINGSGILDICPYTAAGTGFVNITLGSYGNFTIIDGGIVNGTGAGVAGGAGNASTIGNGKQGTRGDTRVAGAELTTANGGGGGGGNRTSASSAGSGAGGGFGGAGGRGSNSSNAALSWPGTGGGTAGSNNDASILYVGSGGGGGAGDAANAGGRGGGGFSVNAGSGSIFINGTINMSGGFGVGADSTDSAAGGGGSGGHVILIGREVNVSLAKIDVRGGRGGNTGANARDCGGGGGGGGRVVFVYQNLTNSSASIFSDGGAVGSGSCTNAPAAGTAGSEYWNSTTANAAWPAVDREYPSFINAWDNNGTLNTTGIAFFNATIENTNGSAFLQINGTNFTATNWTATLFNISITMINNTYPYQWISWGNGTNRNINKSVVRYYTVNETLVDREYPSFINAWDNNGTLNSTGIAFFNVTILSNNGSAFLQINGTNFTATNWTATLFNISIIMSNNTYEYQWISWGNGTSKNINKSIIRYYTVNETITNTPPQIISVASIPNIDPTMNDIVGIAFNFSVFDNDGVSNLNSATAMANFTRAGEALRQNSTCVQKEAIGNYANYSCTIEMWYFDDAGNWNITAYIKDNSNTIGFNDSTKFQYNLLKAVVISPNQFTFSVIMGATNQTPNDDPTIINNTGNYNITNISVKGIHLYGDKNSLQFISVENFTVGNNTGGTPPLECIGGGTGLVNGSEIQITNASLIRGNLSQGSGAGQEQIYYCLNQVPSGISSQTYSTAIGGSWIIKILLVVFVPARRRRKKLIKDDNLVKALALIVDELKDKYSLSKAETMNIIVKELKGKYKLNKKELIDILEIRQEENIPTSIFSKELGALEALCKYMKENLGMGYREIAKELNRDERTIWTAYKKAVSKKKEPIEVDKGDIFFPISICKDRKFTILESIIVYLREKGLKHRAIADLLKRDQRNVSTIYSRAVRKLKR